MLVNPRWIPHDPSDDLGPCLHEFKRMLHSAFTAKDNPYLANTFYEYEDGERFSALDRLNYLWYLMFSGFSPLQLDPGAPDPHFASLTSCHTAISQDVTLFSESLPPESDNHLTTIIDVPAVSPQQNRYNKRMEFSRDQFLHSLPNPNEIYGTSKGQGSIPPY